MAEFKKRLMSGFTMNLCKSLFPVSDFAKIIANFASTESAPQMVISREKDFFDHFAGVGLVNYGI